MFISQYCAAVYLKNKPVILIRDISSSRVYIHLWSSCLRDGHLHSTLPVLRGFWETHEIRRFTRTADFNLWRARSDGLCAGAVNTVSWCAGLQVEAGQQTYISVLKWNYNIIINTKNTVIFTVTHPGVTRRSWNSTWSSGRKEIWQNGQVEFRLESSAVQPAMISSSYTRASQERHWEQLDIRTCVKNNKTEPKKQQLMALF